MVDHLLHRHPVRSPPPSRCHRRPGVVGHRAGLSGPRPAARSCARAASRVAGRAGCAFQDLPPSSVAACVGTKEFVASSSCPSQASVAGSQERHRVVSRRLAASDLRHGGGAWRRPRLLSRSRPPQDGSGGCSFSTPSIPRTPSAPPLLWSNLRRRTGPGAWGIPGQRPCPGAAHRGSPVLRIEYAGRRASLGKAHRGRSCSRSRRRGRRALALQALEHHTAGVRGSASTPGDAELLVELLRAVRQHAGLMVPGPAQAAGVAALSDVDHVEVQRAFLPGTPGFPGRSPRRLRLSRGPAGGRFLPVGAGCPPGAGPTSGRHGGSCSPPTVGSLGSARATLLGRGRCGTRAGGRRPADGAVGSGGRAPG